MGDTTTRIAALEADLAASQRATRIHRERVEYLAGVLARIATTDTNHFGAQERLAKVVSMAGATRETAA